MESFRNFINSDSVPDWINDPRLEDYAKVVIVNNSPEEDISDLKQKYGQWVTFIDNKENVGVSAAWNQIIKEGFDNEGNPLYDYFIPANNDVYFSKNWFVNFTKCLEKDKNKEYGWISSMMNDYKEPDLTGISETVQLENLYWSVRPEADDVDSAEQMENVLKTAYGPFGGIEKFAENLQTKYGIELKESHPKAPLFALSKECIKKVGLFDEYNSPVGLHEDADFCHRVTRGGFKIGRANGAYVHHFSMMSRTRGEFKKSDWVEGREKAFTEKWGVSSKEMDKIPADKKFRLDIGSGERPQTNGHWMHMDVDKQFKDVEYLQTIDEIMPFEDDEFEEIYSSNVIEHVEWKKILSTLFEWRRILKTGGKIHLRCPNAEWLMKRVIEGSWNLELQEGVDFNAQHALMGGDHPGTPHLHKVLLTEKNLGKALADVGFQEIRNVSDPNSWELRLECIK